MNRVGIEGLLGLRRSGGELIFDPCIPSEWSGFTAQIHAKGTLIKVEVRNPHARCRGVRALEVDGRVIASNRITIKEAAGQRIFVHLGEL